MDTFYKIIKGVFWTAIVFIVIYAYINEFRTDKPIYLINNTQHTSAIDVSERVNQRIETEKVTPEEQKILDWLQNNGCTVHVTIALGKPILYVITWTYALQAGEEDNFGFHRIHQINSDIIGSFYHSWSPIVHTYDTLKKIMKVKMETM